MNGRALVAVVATLGPAFLLVVAWFVLAATPPWTPQGMVPAHDQALQKVTPDVVVVGNSKAVTDIDDVILKEALDVEGVVRLREFGSPAANWYAMLKYRVYAGGYKPKVVIVAGHIPAMLTAVPTGKALVGFQNQFAEPDEVIEKKALGGNARAARIREKATEYREELLGGVRDAVVGLLFAEAYAEGPAMAEKAMGKVFAQGEVGAGGQAQVGPIALPEGRSMGEAVQVSVGDSFVPDLVKLGQDNGAKVIFVALPFAPSSDNPDTASPEAERSLIEKLNEMGAGFVDLRDLHLDDTAFVDSGHMNKEGREQATNALAERLLAMGVLDDGGLRPAAVPVLPSKVERLGTVPTLPALDVMAKRPPCGFDAKVPALNFLSEPTMVEAGLAPEASPVRITVGGTLLGRRVRREELGPGCVGKYAHFKGLLSWSSPAESPGEARAVLTEELPINLGDGLSAWWVYPGTTVRLSFSQPWGEGPFVVNASGKALGGGDGVATISVNGAPAVPLTASGVRHEGEAPKGEWTVEVSSPADGPYLLVDSLSFGEEDAESVYIGAPPPATARFFKRAPTYENPPPPIVADAPLQKRMKAQILPLPALSSIASDSLANDDLPGCTPVRMMKGEEVLPIGAYGDIRTEGKTGVVHVKDGMLFSVADPEAWKPSLDPSRFCVRGVYWVYPGDHLEVNTRAVSMKRLNGPASSLALSVAIRGQAVGKLTVYLVAGGKEYYREEVDLSTMPEGVLKRDLPVGIPRSLGEVTLGLVSTTDAPFLLVKSAVVGG